MGDARMPRPTRGQAVACALALACYALGYPLAIVMHTPVGWVLVTLGGVFLLIAGALTVRRITADESLAVPAGRDARPRAQ